MFPLLRSLGWVCAVWSGVTFAAPSATALSKVAQLKDQAKKNHWTFKVGYHRVLEYPIEQVTGLQVPKDWKEKAVFYHPKPLRLPSSFDWRVQAGGLTPIKDQGSCGSCWAFGTVAVFENVLKIRDHIVKPLSEQQLVDCDDNSNGCGGGSFAHHVHVSPGAATSEEYPYEAANGTCRQKNDYPDKIANWGYVGGDNGSPTVDEIKNAIYQYGPVAATVSAGMAMQGYSGGIFNSCGGWMTNHLISIVGWNDADGGYWIMRNSWGKDWGEDGYMRIRYNCALIGDQATFVVYKARCEPQPVVDAGESKAVTRGASVRLGTPAVAGMTYHWSPETGLDDPNAAMPLASPSRDTVYRLQATTSCGSAEAQVRVSVKGS